MPVYADWGDFEETFIVWKFEGNWTWAEFYNALSAVLELFASKPETVNLIVDTRLDKPPGGLLTHFRQVDDVVPRNLGELIVLVNSGFVEMICVLLQKMGVKIVKHARFVRSVDEAYLMIEKYVS